MNMQNNRYFVIGRSGGARVYSGETTRVEACVEDGRAVYAHLFTKLGERLTVPLMYGQGSAAKRFDTAAIILECEDGRLLTGGFRNMPQLREKALSRLLCEISERQAAAERAKREALEAAAEETAVPDKPDAPQRTSEREQSDALRATLKRAEAIFGRTDETPAPFPNRFPGAVWKVTQRGGWSFLEGTYRKDGATYRLTALPGEYSPTPPRGARGFTRFERDGAGRGYWLRVERMS